MSGPKRTPHRTDLCCICGARITNLNKKVTTCDPICQLAKDSGISRERAQRIINARTNQ